MDDKNLEAGYLQAQEITRNFAKTFYLASFFLPKNKRLAAYSVYAICRISDETVDNPKGDSSASDLKELKKKIETAYTDTFLNDNLLLAFRKTIKTYSIPIELFYELIEGMQMDLGINRYANFNELYIYCYKVAGVIGLIMLKIFDSQNSKAKESAIDLGIAMQLTNILRDIKEDSLRNRIYLPLDEMAKFNVSEELIVKGIINNNLKLLIQLEISRARKYYAESLLGVKMLSSWRCRLVVCLMRNMYCAILEEIEKSNYALFLKRLSVKTPKKVIIILKTMLKGEYL